METIIFIGVAVVAWIIWSMMNGNLLFWKLAAKRPDAVYLRMLSEPDIWVIENGDSDVWSTKNKDDYSGPYRLYVPSIDSFIKIYAKSGEIVAAQQRIIESMKHVKSE